jgi:hypothetical protein
MHFGKQRRTAPSMTLWSPAKLTFITDTGTTPPSSPYVPRPRYQDTHTARVSGYSLGSALWGA